MARPFRDVGGDKGVGVGAFESPNVHPRIGLHAKKSQIINMGDVAITLVRAAPTVVTQIQILANTLIADAQSSGAGENLILPPEADCKGLDLLIYNVGGENIVIQSDTPTTIVTLETGLAAILSCDGLAWRALTGLAGDIQSANIADLAITESKMARDLLKYQETSLATADLLALAGTNITVVTAPAANLAVVPIAVHMWLAHGGTDFVQTQGEDQAALRYSGGAEISELGAEAEFTTFIEASADAALYCPNLLVASPDGFVPVAATAIDLDNNGTTSPEWLTGDGSMDIRVYYREVPMALFV